jgi:putative tryptophan/tyrosine transport system substrate-binding protein
MRAKILVYALPALILATLHLAEAQQLSKASRIGFLGGASPSFYAARIEAFRQGLRELGYAEGKNIVVEYWFAEGKPERMRELAEELVRMKCDVIVTASTPATQAAKRATTTIPIVMANISDPVELGLVASLARPGGNITGLTILAPELSGKRLELLKEAVPNLTRVGALWNPTNSSQERIWKEIQAAAQELRLQLQSLEVRSDNDIDIAFEAALRNRTQALIPSPEPLINAHLKRIVEFATKNRLPAMYAGPEAVDAGGLMSYAPNYTDQYRRAAIYVDKILKGAKPSDLPVEQPTKFEFVINLKAAKQIGLTIPPTVLARADKVIK